MTETPVEDFLEHYGKKGMKWGVRKDERGLSDVDTALNVKQRTQVKVAANISALASMGMASNAAATLFQLQSRFEHLRVAQEMQKYAEHSPLIDDAGREAIAQTRSHIVKGLVGSAVGATAISFAVGIVTRRTAKAYFAPLHKVYGDEKGKINKDLKNLSKDIKDGKRPKMTKKQYEAEVTRIVSERLTKDANNAVRPFHELARSQLGTEFNTKNLNVKIEKLPNTDLASKITITTPTGLKLVKAIKNVEHADTDDILAPDMELFFDYKFDSDGHVVEWSCPTLEIANDLFEGRFDVAEITKKYDPESNLQHSDMAVEDFLEHYGTKGMKWGVRKNIQRRSGEARSAWVKEKDAKWVSKVEADPKVSKIARIAARDARKQTKRLKQDYKDRGLNVKKNGLDRTRYDSELASILQHSVERASYKVHKTSPTGLKEVQIHRHPDGSISATIGTRDNAKIRKQQRKIAKADIKASKGPGVLSKTSDTLVKLDRGVDAASSLALAGTAAYKLFAHADNDAPKAEDFDGLEFLLILDDEGFVDDIISPFDDEGDDDLEQSDIDDAVDGFLSHYGVKGMKWGVRRKSKPRPDFMPPVKGSGKPKWQSAPDKKPATPTATPKVKTSRLGKNKKPRVYSEDAAQIREIRLKVRRDGIQSLTNKDLETINKRIELQAKYNKNFPKKKNPVVEAAIDTLLSDQGARKIVDMIDDKKYPMMKPVVEAAINIGKSTRKK